VKELEGAGTLFQHLPQQKDAIERGEALGDWLAPQVEALGLAADFPLRCDRAASWLE
jgi:hypothetical protein